MKNKERLQKLKTLQINPTGGPLFKSPQDCMIRIDNVAPLLKYDLNHYQDFIEHAQYIRITTLSASTLMVHLNSMIGSVNQAIIELENKIEPIQTITAKIQSKKTWHETAAFKIIAPFLIGLLGAYLVYYFGWK